jgi:hypothetical protein
MLLQKQPSLDFLYTPKSPTLYINSVQFYRANSTIYDIFTFAPWMDLYKDCDFVAIVLFNMAAAETTEQF